MHKFQPPTLFFCVFVVIIASAQPVHAAQRTPTALPDGLQGRIAYITSDTIAKRDQLHLINADGSRAVTPVLPSSETHFLGSSMAWAPNGDQLLFINGDNADPLISETSLFNRDGSFAFQPVGAGYYGWSPDGRHFMMEDGSSSIKDEGGNPSAALLVYSLPTTDPVRWSDPAMLLDDAQWLPDSLHVIIVLHTIASGSAYRNSIGILDILTGHKTDLPIGALTAAPKTYEPHFNISITGIQSPITIAPNGSAIALELTECVVANCATNGGPFDNSLYMMRLDAQAPILITKNVGSFGWSPDGKYFAYSANTAKTSGKYQWQLFVGKSDGANATAVVLSDQDPAQDRYLKLSWSPDSKRAVINVVNRVKDSTGVPELTGAIYWAQADGSQPMSVPLANVGGMTVNWAPNSQQALIETVPLKPQPNEAAKWYTIAADGSQLSAFTPFPIVQTDYSIIWSPNSQYLAITGFPGETAAPTDGHPGLFIIELKTGKISTLTTDPVTQVSWVP